MSYPRVAATSEADTKRLELLYTSHQLLQAGMAFQISSMTTAEADAARHGLWRWRYRTTGAPGCQQQWQAQRLPHLALHFGGQYDARHAGSGIVENFDAHPWEVVERVRICDFGAVFRMPRNGRAPRFQERLLAAMPSGRRGVLTPPRHHAIELRPLRRLPYLSRMENRLRIRTSVPVPHSALGERRHVNDVMP